MGEMNTINISALKQYRNDFLNEKSNFKNSTYNAFSSSYTRRCNDSYVQKMCQELESIYKQIDKAYSNIDTWWGSYLENIEGVENNLSENGGSITESVIRSAVSSLPHLMTLKITDLGLQLMNIGMNVKSNVSTTSSSSKRDFSNIFSGYDNPTDKFMSGGKTYEEVESIMKQQKDMDLKNRLNTATTQAFASLDASTNFLFADANPSERTITVDGKVYNFGQTYQVHDLDKLDGSYYTITFINEATVSNTGTVQKIYYDADGNPMKMEYIDIGHNDKLKLNQIFTRCEREGNVLRYYRSDGSVDSEYVLANNNVDISNKNEIEKIAQSYVTYYLNGHICTKGNIDSSIEYYSEFNGQLESKTYADGTKEEYFSDGSYTKQNINGLIEKYYENGNILKTTKEDGSVEHYLEDGRLSTITYADGSRRWYHLDGTYSRYNSENEYLGEYYANGQLSFKKNSDGTTERYYENGILKEKKDSSGNILESYHKNGNIFRTAKEDGSVEFYLEDGRLSMITYADGTKESYVYWKDGTSIKYNRDGTADRYDKNGNLKN